MAAVVVAVTVVSQSLRWVVIKRLNKEKVVALKQLIHTKERTVKYDRWQNSNDKIRTSAHLLKQNAILNLKAQSQCFYHKNKIDDEDMTIKYYCKAIFKYVLDIFSYLFNHNHYIYRLEFVLKVGQRDMSVNGISNTYLCVHGVDDDVQGSVVPFHLLLLINCDYLCSLVSCPDANDSENNHKEQEANAHNNDGGHTDVCKCNNMNVMMMIN